MYGEVKNKPFVFEDDMIIFVEIPNSRQKNS